MLKFVGLLEKNASKLAELDTICMGGPIGPNVEFIIPAMQLCSDVRDDPGNGERETC